VTKAVPADFQQAGDAILLLWPVPRGEDPNPDLKVPFTPEPMRDLAVEGEGEPVSDADAEEPEATASAELAAFGSSEYAKVVLGGVWGTPPALDLEAEADLHTLLGELAGRELVHSAKDVSDGGIAVALAESAIRSGIGAKADQDESLLMHPLFGLFAEPSSTVILTTKPADVEEIAKLADEYGFLAERIGVTGGDKLEISVDREPFISVALAELRESWAESLEASLHNEVLA
jgi:phosphoribosylformylglycinamidine (FGAM) synthase-like enzyme